MKGYRIKRTSLTLMSIMGISLQERKSSLQPGARNYSCFFFAFDTAVVILYYIFVF